ncbi:carbamoyltransferase C-terminal domain-containing protein [Streptomyces sp. DSM 44938]|uniref:Carbamoyltransferase C-terminal domain-containing protein n=2 Tax=Streptomyces litchfieldiae TaxID=3075543 RepID=A0ABU2MTL2_9ACTN|nr:carbamoyltransferase C-terminal domain-containing protein [Streptomyces sp. DSM 44938]
MDRRPDDYALSCYISPPGVRSVLHSRHDQNISLWRRRGDSVELVRMWELERLSGQKHHHWPLYSVERARALLDGLLAEEGLTLADVSTVWGTPGLPAAAELPIPAGAEEFPVHTLGHLFGGLLMDSRIFKEATIIGMAIDTGPDFVQERVTHRYSYAGCVSRQGRLTFAPVESPAPLYAAAEMLFEKEPGTLMALASACRTQIDFDSQAVLKLNLYGGRVHPVSLSLPFVQDIVEEAREQLAGRALEPEFTPDEHLQSAVMSVVQECCELVARRNVERLCELADVRPADCYLSTSGGFALNCPTNSALMNHFGFRGLLTPPCANDSGQSYGLGLLGLHGTGAFDRADHRLESAYYGAELPDTDTALAEFAPWIENVREFSPEQFVADIAQGPLAWVDGAAEIGPRALCHRSLLGDPRSEETKRLLNEYKRRQWWRPVAPVVIEELAGEWFDQDRPSPFMLETALVRPEVRGRVPAILHLDNSARHQTITERVNPLLYRALRAFHAETGVPILCNTSLNDRGEPIVGTVAEALTFCLRRGIPFAYVQGRRVSLRSEPVPAVERPTRPRPRRVDYFAGQEAERDAIWRRWVRAGLTERAMFLLPQMPELWADPEDCPVEDLNALADHVHATDPAFDHWVREFRLQQGPGSSFAEGA